MTFVAKCVMRCEEDLPSPLTVLNPDQPMDGRSESEYGEKWDRCIADTLIKTGAGAGVGGLFSLMFKRKMWPVILGLGIGLGMGMTNCQHDLNHPYYLRVQQLKGKQKEALVENVLIAADTKQGPAAQ